MDAGSSDTYAGSFANRKIDAGAGLALVLHTL